MIFACTVLVAFPDRKGGKRSSLFEDSFRTILPEGLSAKVQNIYSVLKGLEPEEANLHSPDTVLISLIQPTPDMLHSKVAERVCKAVVYMPTDKVHYVFVKRDTFSPTSVAGSPLQNVIYE